MGNALQVCAVAANVAFPVKAEFLVLNGTATGENECSKLHTYAPNVVKKASYACT